MKFYSSNWKLGWMAFLTENPAKSGSFSFLWSINSFIVFGVMEPFTLVIIIIKKKIIMYYF